MPTHNHTRKKQEPVIFALGDEYEGEGSEPEVLGNESPHSWAQAGAQQETPLIVTHQSPTIGRSADIGQHYDGRRRIHGRADTLEEAETEEHPVIDGEPATNRAYTLNQGPHY